VQVSPADAAGGNADQHLIALDGRVWRIGELEWVGLNLGGGIKQTCLHGVLLGDTTK
jgi:hypothetical protein